MNDVQTPQIDCERVHPVLAVDDVTASVEFYTKKLGFKLGFTWGEPPTYAGLNLGDVQIFLRKAAPAPEGCEVFFVVGDADALHEFQRANGVKVIEPPGDREYGLRDYAVQDLYGYKLSFGHYTYTFGEPVRIERVDVPVRLETRLAALLQDLATFKHMSVSSALEETLLHTLDGVGPHTATQLHHIQELKKKHGIDYDTHASYRFVEDK